MVAKKVEEYEDEDACFALGSGAAHGVRRKQRGLPCPPEFARKTGHPGGRKVQGSTRGKKFEKCLSSSSCHSPILIGECEKSSFAPEVNHCLLRKITPRSFCKASPWRTREQRGRGKKVDCHDGLAEQSCQKQHGCVEIPGFCGTVVAFHLKMMSGPWQEGGASEAEAGKGKSKGTRARAASLLVAASVILAPIKGANAQVASKRPASLSQRINKVSWAVEDRMLDARVEYLPPSSPSSPSLPLFPPPFPLPPSMCPTSHACPIHALASSPPSLVLRLAPSPGHFQPWSVCPLSSHCSGVGLHSTPLSSHRPAQDVIEDAVLDTCKFTSLALSNSVGSSAVSLCG